MRSIRPSRRELGRAAASGGGSGRRGGRSCPGWPPQHLRHAEQLVERGGDEAAVDAARRALVGRAEGDRAHDPVVLDLEPSGGASGLARPISGLWSNGALVVVADVGGVGRPPRDAREEVLAAGTARGGGDGPQLVGDAGEDLRPAPRWRPCAGSAPRTASASVADLLGTLGSRSREVHDHRGVVRRRRLPLRALRSTRRPRRPLGDGPAGEHQVDAHAAVLVEVAGPVVPPGVEAGRRRGAAGTRRPGPSRSSRRSASRSAGRDVGRAADLAGSHTSRSSGAMLKSPHDHDVGRGSHAASRWAAQPAEPPQLVLVLLVVRARGRSGT